MSEEFLKAAEDAKSLSKSPSNDQLLKLYSLYKQVTVGDCNTDRPGMLDMKGKAKWDAWNGIKGKSKDEAQNEYIALVKELQGSSFKEVDPKNIRGLNGLIFYNKDHT